MMDVSAYQGIGQFGPAYRIMLENDCHAAGSGDRVLLERMVRLCGETADYLYRDYTPTSVTCPDGVSPELAGCVEAATAACSDAEEKVVGIARFTSGLGRHATDDLDAIRVGGTEEEIISRGSWWCTDVARVGCAMCQIAGVPARMVYLADTEAAYWGHAIIEAWRAGRWGAVDAARNVVFRDEQGRPASTWQLMNDHELILAHQRPEGTAYTTPGTFRAAAISNYSIGDRAHYSYAVAGINDYCREVNEMADQGWPGGLRWLRGEDKA
jgi:transglutaminase-like putative cysteine protease